MTNDRVELMLENLTKAQNRLVMYLSLGFVAGFSLGVIMAWVMIMLR
jgi:hypothetical protein